MVPFPVLRGEYIKDSFFGLNSLAGDDAGELVLLIPPRTDDLFMSFLGDPESLPVFLKYRDGEAAGEELYMAALLNDGRDGEAAV